MYSIRPIQTQMQSWVDIEFHGEPYERVVHGENDLVASTNRFVNISKLELLWWQF